MNENDIREQDYQQGFACEMKIMDKLRKQHGLTIESTSRYDTFDFIANREYLGEIKHRNVCNDTFDTTILPYSKLKEYQKVKNNYKDLILIFRFKNNNDYFIKYSQLMHLNKPCKKVKIAKFTRYAGFQHNNRLHVFI